jgi:hypothetical protein
MGDHTFPKLSCKLCNRPVDLQVDLYADENGQIVHQDCYVNRITNQKTAILLSRLEETRLTAHVPCMA